MNQAVREAGKSGYANGHQRLETGRYILVLLLIEQRSYHFDRMEHYQGQNFPIPKMLRKPPFSIQPQVEVSCHS